MRAPFIIEFCGQIIMRSKTGYERCWPRTSCVVVGVGNQGSGGGGGSVAKNGPVRQ